MVRLESGLERLVRAEPHVPKEVVVLPSERRSEHVHRSCYTLAVVGSGLVVLVDLERVPCLLRFAQRFRLSSEQKDRSVDSSRAARETGQPDVHIPVHHRPICVCDVVLGCLRPRRRRAGRHRRTSRHLTILDAAGRRQSQSPNQSPTRARTAVNQMKIVSASRRALSRSR